MVVKVATNEIKDTKIIVVLWVLLVLLAQMLIRFVQVRIKALWH